LPSEATQTVVQSTVHSDVLPLRPGAPTFIDLFAGCGGLSLGLMLAGWDGLFAVEHELNAFSTLRANLIDGKPSRPRYRWPAWLKQEPVDIETFVHRHERDLKSLRGQVDLIAGGPPCQGFSFAGRRRPNDQRNHLIEHYLRVVSLVQPTFLLVENVEGIAIKFGKNRLRRRGVKADAYSHAARIRRQLGDAGYHVQAGVVRGADVGVPQRRPRYIMLGVLAEHVNQKGWSKDPFACLGEMRLDFLASKDLPLDGPVGVGEALSDLETAGRPLIPCGDSKGFLEATYAGPRTVYQRLMRDGMASEAPNSMRLAQHREQTLRRFRLALEHSRKGVTLTTAERHALGMMNKHQFKILDPELPAHTLTTLPDDLLHYSEPRILTVREYARLQSFPDYYSFHGKYTTGGELRAKEAPRYTQVGNAVPPLMAEVLGWLLLSFHTERASATAGAVDSSAADSDRQTRQAAIA
jgi:DNA (cytosine-5)-methyltransferase 1